MTLDVKTATLAGGLRLPYVEHGDPDGVPLVLLHGYSDSLRSWELLLPELPSSLHAFAPTQRGHGDADRPERGYGPADHASDAAAFMDAVGIEAAIIVGHSGGSYTAQRFALDHPGRTLGVVLIGAFRAIGESPGVSELMAAVSSLTDPVDPGFVREFQESCVAQPIPDGFMDDIVAESCKVPARVWKAYLEEFLAAGAPTRSGTITVPALVVWGDHDAFCPRSEQEALAAAIPGARLVVYPGTAHTPHWEQPARTAADLVAFAAAVAKPVLREAVAS